MAETVGISRSAVSREMVEASTRTLKEFTERRFDDVDLLIIYLYGMQFDRHYVLLGVGVDGDGQKHVLGAWRAAGESAELAKALLGDPVERRVKPERRRLFVIDGSKALRRAIDEVYGHGNPVQRCWNHKLRNVLGHLPKEDHDQVKDVIRAAWRLEAREGEARASGPLAGAGASVSGGQPAGRARRDVHHQQAGAAGIAQAVSGQHESHR